MNLKYHKEYFQTLKDLSPLKTISAFILIPRILPTKTHPPWERKIPTTEFFLKNKTFSNFCHAKKDP